MNPKFELFARSSFSSSEKLRISGSHSNHESFESRSSITSPSPTDALETSKYKKLMLMRYINDVTEAQAEIIDTKTVDFCRTLGNIKTFVTDHLR